MNESLDYKRATLDDLHDWIMLADRLWPNHSHDELRSILAEYSEAGERGRNRQDARRQGGGVRESILAA